ncbi:hypothetical protein [Microbulbifer sp. 2205BS26-8]|uniref:hypothetical protein n=1 Tax=Microbulbifer sp. 2205BS26-8 TaxID=3064386 RepID=UPI00273E12EA|nr:hypothetical protein [Microbulbifer sp. 2205BS26-8]MDP5211037.1 hypothetical protein [Microbulbifer sp. 2205BS26-8]
MDDCLDTSNEILLTNKQLEYLAEGGIMPLMSTDGVTIGYVEKDSLRSTPEKMRLRFTRTKDAQ